MKGWQIGVTETKLNENTIKVLQKEIVLRKIPCYRIFSEQFIMKCEDKVDWVMIGEYQFLSESFMRRNKDETV